MMLTNTVNPWKIILAILVGVFLAGMLISLVIAARRVSRVVDADYYSHGLHYGKTGSGAINRGMRWTLSASLTRGKLLVQVKDEAGAPIAGGKLRFEPERMAGIAGGAVALAESAPGTFTATRPVSPQGELHGTLLFTMGDDVAARKVVFFN